MNYFYFFFFLSLSAIILFKPFAKSISDWIVKSDNLNKTGLITFFIGISLASFSLMQSFWYERMWMVVTLILGILLLIRSLFILFFIEKIKKILPVFIGNYYKFTIPISITMVFLAFLIVTTDYIGPQKDISNCESDNQIQVICKFNNSEDIVITPDKEFLFMSQMGSIAPWGDNEPGSFAMMNLGTNK